MNQNRLTTLFLVVLPLGYSAGCTPGRIDLKRDGTVTVAISDCHPVTLSAEVEREGDETIVYGIVSHSSTSNLGNIHIDVTVVMANGETVRGMTLLAFPRQIYTGRRSNKSHFAVWFPFVPPPGSQVKLVCHVSPHASVEK